MAIKECTPKTLYRLVKERALAGDNIDQFCAYMIAEGYDTPASSTDKAVYWRGQYNALRKAVLSQEKTARASGNVKAIDAAVQAAGLTKLADKPKGKSGKSGGNKAKQFADMFAADIAELADDEDEEADESKVDTELETASK